MVVEKLLRLPGSVHHLIINTGDVEHQAYHETETCTQPINNDSESERERKSDTRERAWRSLYSNPNSCTSVARVYGTDGVVECKAISLKNANINKAMRDQRACIIITDRAIKSDELQLGKTFTS